MPCIYLDKFQMNQIFKCKDYNDRYAQRKHGQIYYFRVKKAFLTKL